MTKQTFLKTLLPITSIVLIGGGVASSLILTSCGKNGVDTWLYSDTEVSDYLEANKLVLPAVGIPCNLINNEYVVSDNSIFFNYMNKNFKKQNFLNGFVEYAYYGVGKYDIGSLLRLHIYNEKGKTHIDCWFVRDGLEVQEDLIIDYFDSFYNFAVNIGSIKYTVSNAGSIDLDSTRVIYYPEVGLWSCNITTVESRDTGFNFMLSENDAININLSK